MSETWSELRCPACTKLGWESSRLLLKIYGDVLPQDVILQLKCHRCKSIIEWKLGTFEFKAAKLGPENHRRQAAAFE